MSAEIDRETVEKVYARWAPVYDFVFGPVFTQSRRLSVEAAQRVGGRILELGVGTGISLPAYGRDTRVVGVDISEPMLRKAQERVTRERLKHVEGLAVMDAAHLGFADGSFDCAVAQFVITTVPDPEGTLDELARVVRPGGEIVLVNHISAERGPLADFERWFARHSGHFGWRAEFPFARIANWVARHGGVRILERRVVPPFSMFSLIRLERLDAAVGAHAAAG
jgi:phosphatidylethanolamine/phosphatidyl-N-methylethanolamine N-methyltransferase